MESSAKIFGTGGLPVDKIKRNERLSAIARMLASEEPYLLDMAISRDQDVYPMVAPGAALDDPIGAIDVAVGAVRSDVRKEDGR